MEGLFLILVIFGLYHFLIYLPKERKKKIVALEANRQKWIAAMADELVNAFKKVNRDEAVSQKYDEFRKKGFTEADIDEVTQKGMAMLDERVEKINKNIDNFIAKYANDDGSKWK